MWSRNFSSGGPRFTGRLANDGTCVAAQSGMLVDVHSQSRVFLRCTLAEPLARVAACACLQGDLP